ncbi:MAG: ABC transporter permease [Steroidobacteraceae bacterium]
MNAWRRFRAIAAKEARQLARDRVTFGLIIGIPLMQMLLFGYAINFDVRDLRAVVLDEAHSSRSREYVAALQATQVLKVVGQARSSEELDLRLRSGSASLGVVIPPDFDRRLQDSSRPAAQILVDGSEPSIEGVAAGLALQPLRSRHGGGGNATVPPVEIRTLYNPAKRTAVQIVPALVGVILTMTMVIFTAGAIVRERERGNLELLIATPVGRLDLLGGKLAPYVVIGLIQTTLVLFVGRWLFQVPIVGHLFELYVACMLFIAATLSLGLFISTLAQTQFQAFQLAFVTMLPSILMSGFMFPFEGMPQVAQWIAQLLPLTHFNVLVRGIVLRGAHLDEMLPQVAKLLAFFLILMTAAVLRFQKRIG